MHQSFSGGCSRPVENQHQCKPGLMTKPCYLVKHKCFTVIRHMMRAPGSEVSYLYIYMVVVQYSCLLKRPFFAKKTLTFAKLSRTLCFSFAGVHHVMKPFNLVGTRFLNTVCGVAMGYGVPLEPIHSPKPSPDFRETFAK